MKKKNDAKWTGRVDIRTWKKFLAVGEAAYKYKHRRHKESSNCEYYVLVPTPVPFPPDVQQGQGYVLLYCLLSHLLKTNSKSGLFFHRQIVQIDIQLKTLRTF